MIYLSINRTTHPHVYNTYPIPNDNPPPTYNPRYKKKVHIFIYKYNLPIGTDFEDRLVLGRILDLFSIFLLN